MATYDVLHFAGSAHECILEELRAFADREPCTFAKTYAETWPHEYLVRDRVGSKQLFVQLVEHIRSHGCEANVYARTTTYFDIEEFRCRRLI
jgi:hypothetical protein